MPWYKIDIRHGPGHQARSIRYEYRTGKATKDDKREMFDDLARDEYMDYPIGEVKAVSKLPEKIRLEKISEFQSRLNGARFMLKVLGAKP